MSLENDEENIFYSNGSDSENNVKMKEENKEEKEEIDDTDSWQVIRAYFRQHGLVSQQIGSFNQFVGRNIQEIIDENKTIVIDPDINYEKIDNVMDHTKYELTFNQSRIAANPQFLENNSNNEKIIFPNEARVRNLDYLSKLSLDVTWKEINKTEVKEIPHPNMNIGKIPIMVRSKYCSLNEKDDTERVNVKECEFDQGGYFIIGGGEKVIVAQERMATNFVYVFNKKEQSGYTWQAEVRSNIDGSNRPPILFSVKISKKNIQINWED